ncbi:hypothetical protein SAMN05444412_1199 [Rhodonellum ikkaensis]|uniref:Uncharacterized protein n=1 Tax=Rhodonellum ikkaensis TaxID=336829 RepID=A0A1H3TMA7_9BACT|nr:hypothetical protein SAMN05444412_1199 [Rhodonellum ikkaensis]
MAIPIYLTLNPKYPFSFLIGLETARKPDFLKHRVSYRWGEVKNSFKD